MPLIQVLVLSTRSLQKHRSNGLQILRVKRPRPGPMLRVKLSTGLYTVIDELECNTRFFFFLLAGFPDQTPCGRNKAPTPVKIRLEMTVSSKRSRHNSIPFEMMGSHLLHRLEQLSFGSRRALPSQPQLGLLRWHRFYQSDAFSECDGLYNTAYAMQYMAHTEHAYIYIYIYIQINIHHARYTNFKQTRFVG